MELWTTFAPSNLLRNQKHHKMKKITSILIVLTIAAAVFAGNNHSAIQPETTTVSMDKSYTGTVTKKAEFWVIQVVIGGETKDLYPTNLAKEYKVAGKVVNFTCTIGHVPADIRIAGTPIFITSITSVN
jgi:hypothetical protein